MKVVNYDWCTLGEIRAANRLQNAQSLLHKLREKQKAFEKSKKQNKCEDQSDSKGIKDCSAEKLNCAYSGSNIMFKRYRVDEDSRRSYLIEQIKQIPLQFAGTVAERSLETNKIIKTPIMNIAKRENTEAPSIPIMKPTHLIDLFYKRRINFSQLNDRQSTDNLHDSVNRDNRDDRHSIDLSSDMLLIRASPVKLRERRRQMQHDKVSRSVDDVFYVAVKGKLDDIDEDSEFEAACQRRETLRLQRIQKLVSKRQEMRRKLDENKSIMDVRIMSRSTDQHTNKLLQEKQPDGYHTIRRKFVLNKSSAHDKNKATILPRLNLEKSSNGISNRGSARQTYTQKESRMLNRYPKPDTDFKSKIIAPWNNPESSDRIDDLLNF